MEKGKQYLTSATGIGLGGVGLNIPYQAPLHLQTQKRQESACGFQALLVKVEGAQIESGGGLGSRRARSEVEVGVANFGSRSGRPALLDFCDWGVVGCYAKRGRYRAGRFIRCKM